MAILNEEQRKIIKDYLDKEMDREVRMIMFTQLLNCDTCADTEDLLKEVAELSDKIKVEIKPKKLTKTKKHITLH